MTASSNHLSELRPKGTPTESGLCLIKNAVKIICDPITWVAKKNINYHQLPWENGACMCLGIQFPYIRTKAIIARLLPHFSFGFLSEYKTERQSMPLTQPIDDIPITMKALT